MATQTQVSLNGLNPQQFTILIIESSKVLNWTVNIKDENTLELATSRSTWSYGETVNILIDLDTAFIESKYTQWQLSGNKKNKKNVEELVEQIEAAREKFSPGQLTEMYDQMASEQQAYATDLQERIQQNKLTAYEKISLGVGGYHVTYGLMIANFAVFLIMILAGVSAFDPSVPDLIKWGGNLRSLVIGGEWYRLLTNIFIHAGIIHILFNMYALFYIGRFLEPLTGRWRFLVFYICTGIFASATSIWWSGDRVSVGASGAIFGMYGVFLALLTTNLVEKNVRKGMLQSIGIFVVYNLAYGMKGGIDNAAHVGGLVSGFVSGYVTYLLFLKKTDKQLVSNLTIIGITMVAAFSLLSFIKDDTAKFEKDFSHFAELEEKALKPLRNASDTTSAVAFVNQLTDITKPAWIESKKVFENTRSYQLNDFLKERRKKFENYIDLRILQTDLLIARNTNNDVSIDKRIDSVTTEINKVVESLSKE